MKELKNQPSRKNDEKAIHPDTKEKTPLVEKVKKLGRVMAIAGPAILSATAPAKADPQADLRDAIKTYQDIGRSQEKMIDTLQEALSYKFGDFDRKTPDLTSIRVPTLDVSALDPNLQNPARRFGTALGALESMKSIRLLSAKELLAVPQNDAEKYVARTQKQLMKDFSEIEQSGKALEEALQYGVHGYTEQYRAISDVRIKLGGYSIYLSTFNKKSASDLFSGMKEYREAPEKYATKGTKKYDAAMKADFAAGAMHGPHRWLGQLAKDLPPLLAQLEKSFEKLKNSGAR